MWPSVPTAVPKMMTYSARMTFETKHRSDDQLQCAVWRQISMRFIKQKACDVETMHA